MTLEDFIESVIAGWMPLAVHPAAHVAVVAWRWVADHAPVLVPALIARFRK